jgi:hypothetical protein
LTHLAVPFSGTAVNVLAINNKKAFVCHRLETDFYPTPLSILSIMATPSADVLRRLEAVASRLEAYASALPEGGIHLSCPIHPKKISLSQRQPVII